MRKTLETAMASMKNASETATLEHQPLTGNILLSEWARKADIDLVAAEALISGLALIRANSLNNYYSRLQERIFPYFQKTEGIVVWPGYCKMVALVGPTVVGKKTTVAKLAANFALRDKFWVALITADTYRIAAVEQLKTYDDLIGIPIEVVYTPQELRTALYQHCGMQSCKSAADGGIGSVDGGGFQY